MESKNNFEEILTKRFFALNNRAITARNIENEISAVEAMIKIYEALKKK